MIKGTCLVSFTSLDEVVNRGSCNTTRSPLIKSTVNVAETFRDVRAPSLVFPRRRVGRVLKNPTASIVLIGVFIIGPGNDLTLRWGALKIESSPPILDPFVMLRANKPEAGSTMPTVDGITTVTCCSAAILRFTVSVSSLS